VAWVGFLFPGCHIPLEPFAVTTPHQPLLAFPARAFDGFYDGRAIGDKRVRQRFRIVEAGREEWSYGVHVASLIMLRMP
jgi:hypothetical protein